MLFKQNGPGASKGRGMTLDSTTEKERGMNPTVRQTDEAPWSRRQDKAYLYASCVRSMPSPRLATGR